ncbi:hypothetical protein JB92DRAFT_1264454 [Gautieria morchelliformis]|nr:hypothetical protein JB92DRAFT_1264454 [Gautieria morchelliformis]
MVARQCQNYFGAHSTKSKMCLLMHLFGCLHSSLSVDATNKDREVQHCYYHWGISNTTLHTTLPASRPLWPCPVPLFHLDGFFSGVAPSRNPVPPWRHLPRQLHYRPCT